MGQRELGIGSLKRLRSAYCYAGYAAKGLLLSGHCLNPPGIASDRPSNMLRGELQLEIFEQVLEPAFIVFRTLCFLLNAAFGLFVDSPRILRALPESGKTVLFVGTLELKRGALLQFPGRLLSWKRGRRPGLDRPLLPPEVPRRRREPRSSSR